MNSSNRTTDQNSREDWFSIKDIKAEDPLFVYGLPAGVFILVLLVIILCYLVCCCDRENRKNEKETLNITKKSKGKPSILEDKKSAHHLQTTDPNQSTRLLYTPQLSNAYNPQNSKKASNWSLYIDAGHRNLSRASSRTSGLAFYSDDPVNGAEGEDAVFVESGNLTHLQVKQSSLQPIKRENSFSPS